MPSAQIRDNENNLLYQDFSTNQIGVFFHRMNLMGRKRKYSNFQVNKTTPSNNSKIKYRLKIQAQINVSLFFSRKDKQYWKFLKKNY